MLWWQGWKRMEMEFESHQEFPCGSRELGSQISTNQHEAAKSANVNKHGKKKGAKGSDVISSVIYANQHFASTFLMQIFKFQRCSLQALLPFPALPPECPRELVRRLHHAS